MDWEKIWRLYWVDVKSFAEMAEEVGTSGATIRRQFTKWGFQVRPRGAVNGQNKGKLTDKKLKALIDDLEAGKKSGAELGRKYGVSKQRIHQIKNGYRRAA